ncbi:hypothetical protein XENTR_v10013632 [Xenopus tropicalis]|nr:hypothetical protein XENTR_v10013632 [Xenopus tropicalis]
MSLPEETASPGFFGRVRRLYSILPRWRKEEPPVTSSNKEPAINEVHTSQEPSETTNETESTINEVHTSQDNTISITQPKPVSPLETDRMVRLQCLKIHRDVIIDKIKTLRQEIQILTEELDKFELEIKKERKFKFLPAYQHYSDTDEDSEEE